MNRISLVTALAITIATAPATFAQAQSGNPVCAERTSLISQLKARHGEIRRSVGLQQNAGVIETYANAETGTWTIIITMPTGLSCLVAVGENWREDSVATSKPDEAA